MLFMLVIVYPSFDCWFIVSKIFLM